MLKFDKEAARKKYLEVNATLQQDEVRLNRLLLRHELLVRNALFEKEWLELEELHKTGPRAVYYEKSVEFFKRWKISHPGGLHQLTGYPGAPVEVVDADYTGKIKIEVNLNLPVTRLLNEVERELKRWHSSWQDMQKNGIKETYPYCDELRGNRVDLDKIYTSIQVWDLKQKGLTEKQINNTLDSKINVAEPAKEYYKAVKKMIKNGPPGFPPFPHK